MKKSMSVLTALCVVGSLGFAKDIKIEKGWQIRGADRTFTINDFNKSECIKTVWSYDGKTKSWKAYSPNKELNQKIANSLTIQSLSKIDENEGFWIFATKNCYIKNSKSCDSNVKNLYKIIGHILDEKNGVTDIKISKDETVLYADIGDSVYGVEIDDLNLSDTNNSYYYNHYDGYANGQIAIAKNENSIFHFYNWTGYYDVYYEDKEIQKNDKITIGEDTNLTNKAYDLVVAESKNKLYVLDDNGIKVIKITPSKEKIELVNKVEINGTTDYMHINISKDENYLYMTTYKDFIILDINDSTTPKIVGKWSSNKAEIAGNFRISADNKRAYVVYGNDGLKVFNIENPNKPTLLFEIDTKGDSLDVEVSKDQKHVYVANGLKGVIEIDITDPANPQFKSIYEKGYAQSLLLAKDEQILFVGKKEKGIDILKVK